MKTKYAFLFSGPLLRIEAQREVVTMPGIS
jgi:hypothetical protein